jgi:uncharacterized OB-fold protein
LTEYSKPIPIPDEETSPFWKAVRNHELMFQRCQHCGTFAHPPVAFCEHCHNLSDPTFQFEPVDGLGRIVSWTVMWDAMVSGFEGDSPWVHALVEMDQQSGLTFTATLEDGPAPGLTIGAPVEVVFRDVTPTVTLPYFRLQIDIQSGL